MGADTLSTNSKKLDDVDAIIKSAYEKKRKLIEQSKVIVYSEIAKLYNLEGQALVDAVTKEHTLISKFTESGMTCNEIEELADDADNSSDDDETDKQTSFFSEERNPYAV